MMTLLNTIQNEIFNALEVKLHTVKLLFLAP